MRRDGPDLASPFVPLRSPKLPLLEPSLANLSLESFADLSREVTACASRPFTEAASPSFARTLWSAAEAVVGLPRIERPNDKGGDGIFVERTLLDALLPFNATLSVVLAFVTASANEMTRTNKVNDIVNYLAGEEDEPGTPPSLPWEWDRVGHDTVGNMVKDAGSQTLTRYVERRTKDAIGSNATYCELLKHAHKAACNEYHTCKAVVGARSASLKAARLVAVSPTFYVVRALTVWLADVFVDGVAWARGQLSTAKLGSNCALKLAKYSLSAVLCLGLGTVVPFIYPHPYLFLGVEQLVANLTAEALVAKVGTIEPS